MIDSIYTHGTLNLKGRTYKYSYDAVRDGLTTITDEGISLHYNQPFLKGKVDNFHVQIKGDKIFFNGSLCKYLLGENVSTLSKVQIDEALKKLTEQMGYPVRQATLSRIDVSTNLLVQHTPAMYLQCLDFIQNADLLSWGGTKTFKRSRESITFYDKDAEMKEKDPVRHQKFGGKNMLRYELSLRSRLKDLVGQDDLRVLWLHSSSFLEKLALLWVKHYENVIKKPISFVPNMNSSKAYRAYNEYLGFLTKGGLEQTFKEIDIYRKLNNWTTNSASKLKRDYKEFYLNENFAAKSPLVEELDDLIYASKEMLQFILP